jgi:hypothetical protein
MIKTDQADRSATPFRGSRKHLLDLLGSPHYIQILNDLLHGRVVITGQDDRRPQDKSSPGEWELPKYCEVHFSDCHRKHNLADWWLPLQLNNLSAKGVTWDLISTCLIGGKKGLLLVEAKAHEKELDYGGKLLKSNASLQSQVNHKHITERLKEASDGLKRKKSDVNIGIKTHYQLSNRVAWGWKLAECGLPVALLYLGFHGDTYFNDYFRDSDHWQRSMGAYMSGILPLSLPGFTIMSDNGGEFMMFVESLPVIEVSVESHNNMNRR